eukprot:931132-Prymnesium_polylepis.1
MRRREVGWVWRRYPYNPARHARGAAPAAVPAISPSPTWSKIAATVRRVAAARAAAALRAAPL